MCHRCSRCHSQVAIRWICPAHVALPSPGLSFIEWAWVLYPILSHWRAWFVINFSTGERVLSVSVSSSVISDDAYAVADAVDMQMF